MAGPTTAERGARPQSESGRPGPGNPGRGPRLSLRGLIVVLVVILALLGGVFWALYGSSWFRLTTVRTGGTVVLTPRQVERAARAPLGTPLISLDTDTVAARIARELPRVDTVEVSRSWPHAVELKVTERKPVLLLAKGDRFEEVDATGARFDTVGTPPAGVPLLEWSVPKSSAPPRFTTTRLLREAATVRAALPAPVARATRSLRVRSYDAVSLNLSGGRTVMWGSGEDGPAKARALTALMKAAPKARHFDVSAPGAPAASGS